MLLQLKYVRDEPKLFVSGLVNDGGRLRQVKELRSDMIKIDPNTLVDKKYIGVPFDRLGRDIEKGLDCIGIVWKYLTDHGYQVPDTDGLPIPRDWKKSDAERMLRACLKLGDICPLNKLNKFDIVLFVLSDKRIRHPDHIAVMVNRSCFLHILEDKTTEVVRINEFWKSRFLGAIRLGPRLLIPEGQDVRIKL